jgi:Domain of unknown function (DUF397)
MEEPAAALNLAWRKSSYSSNGGGACIEAAHILGAVLVRDTKDNGDGPVLRATPADWGHFMSAIRAGRTQLLAPR